MTRRRRRSALEYLRGGGRTACKMMEWQRQRRLSHIAAALCPEQAAATATTTETTTAVVTMDDLVEEFSRQNATSKAWFDRAQASLPMGNSRTGSYYKPFPIYWESGEGPYVFDVDGNKRLDFVNQATVLTLGHSYPAVAEVLQARAVKGTAFFGPSRYEVELAELLKERIPSMEHIRFCSSGTEAVMNAHRVARAFTGRPVIAKFEGAYHGVDDPALVSYLPQNDAQKGEIMQSPESDPASVAVSPGLAPGTVETTLILPFNDAESTARIITERADDIAAVIIDPLSTAAGTCIPQPEFLATLREVTAKHGILLIFDEIVAFRIAPGGAQSVFGIKPDLTTLGKVIAGGCPGAAFGGREDVMALYRPDNPERIPQSGTFNAAPLTAEAGLATLRTMTPEVYDVMEQRAIHVAESLSTIFKEYNIVASVLQVGSFFQLFFLPTLPSNYREAALDSSEKHNWLIFALTNRGVHWRNSLTNCSYVMDDEKIEEMLGIVREVLKGWPFDD